MTDIKEIVDIAVEAIADKKGTDIKVFNISEISPLADYFIIATGNNKNQNQAIIDEVNEKLNAVKIHPRQIEGYENANWILSDYGDIMIHIFNPESREFYNLERLWKDAPCEER